jgi:hypothetical protein
VNPNVEFVQSLGFAGVVEVEEQRYDPSRYLCFRYSSFDPPTVRSVLGRPIAHTSVGLFVFSIAKDKAVRVDTKKRTLMLGNGAKSVQQFLSNCK